MTSRGPRWDRAVPLRGELRPDLARKAVLIGGPAAAVAVVLALMNGSRAPAEPDPTAATSPAMAAGTESDPAKSHAHSGKSGDSEEDSGKSGDSEEEAGESGGSKHSGESGGPKHSGKSSGSKQSGGSGIGGGLGTSAGSRVLPPNFSVPPRGSSAGRLVTPSGAAETADPPSLSSSSDASLTCTKVVKDPVSLTRAASGGGPGEVICMRGGPDRGSASAPGKDAAPPLPSAGHGERSPSEGGGVRADAGKTDAGKTDAGKTDAGKTDAGKTDGEKTDAGKTDGKTDVGEPKSGSARVDIGPIDADAPDQASCTTEVTDVDALGPTLKSARAGDTICINIDILGLRLRVTTGGPSGSSVQVVGDGQTTARGVTDGRGTR